MAEAPLICTTYKRRELQSKNQNSTENPNNNGVQVEEDRLSSLPNTLLIKILSLLPIKSAAATSVLSHRWRPLWTQLPHLFLDGDNPPWNLSRRPSNPDSPTREQTFIRFKDIVHHILRQITSPIIQTFNLRIPDLGVKSKLCPAILESFLSILFTRNVGAIKVIPDPFSSFTPDVYLPTCIFEIRSLVQLQLGGRIYCKLPEIGKGIVKLPNLKKLELGNILFDDLQKFWALINSCRNLEVLSIEMEFCSKAGVVNISLPKLKSLIIKRIITRGFEFVIDTPMLEHLALHSSVGYYNFVNYPSKLINAELYLWDLSTIRKFDLFSQVQFLLPRISGAQFITLGCFLGFFKALDYFDVDVESIFYNVTHLILLGPCQYDMNDYCFNFQNPIPLCLLSKLKNLEISLTGNDKDVELIEYILSQAIVLERLYVSSSYTLIDDSDEDEDEDEDDDPEYVDSQKYQLWWEYKIYKTFLAIPKSSLLNEIEFKGDYIRVSSDRSQNGLIVTLKNQNSASLH